MMRFRRFNEQGVKAFAEYLGVLRANPEAPVPTHLLTSPRLTEPAAVTIEAEVPTSFASRMEFARWLHAAATASDVEIPLDDAGFWAWLSLALFDHVCPADEAGRRKPKDNGRYLRSLNSNRGALWHLLVGSHVVFYSYRDDPKVVNALLCSHLSSMNEAFRLFGESRIVHSRPSIKVVNRLFHDPSTRDLRRGAQSRKRGSMHRLAKHFNRLARTVDLDSVPANQLLDALIPPEFDRWRRVILFDDFSQQIR